MKHSLAGLVAIGLASCGSIGNSTEIDDTERDAAAFMQGYTEAWNRHAAGEVAAGYYDMGMSVEEQTAALDRTFEQLRSQGYDQSTIHEIEACETGEGSAWAGMKFTRLKTDGTPLGPALRASEYQLSWDDDRGWRINGVGGRDPEAPLVCPTS